MDSIHGAVLGILCWIWKVPRKIPVVLLLCDGVFSPCKQISLGLVEIKKLMYLYFLRNPLCPECVQEQISIAVRSHRAEKCFVVCTNIRLLVAGEKQSSKPNKFIFFFNFLFPLARSTSLINIQRVVTCFAASVLVFYKKAAREERSF